MPLMNGRHFLWQVLSLSSILVDLPVSGQDLEQLMPLPEDHSSMWWAEGFPGVVPDAPWLRVIETGRYAFVLNTETLEVPHFGAFPTSEKPERSSVWQTLPAAELTLKIDVNGKTYHCTRGGEWKRFTGPRLIESGRFFQRADVTDLVFETPKGDPLNTKARFETAAWPDRLGLIFSAEPGEKPIQAGRDSFGKIGGGFGFDGTNTFELPHAPEIDTPQFTIEFQAFVPVDYRVSEVVWPWLVCKNLNESVDGNFGIMIVNGKAIARMNIRGGAEGQITVGDRDVKLEAWNHFAMSYDGDTFRFYLNGVEAGEEKVGTPRNPNTMPLVFGRRGDNYGDGYHFKGVIDEIRVYDRALPLAEIRQRIHNPARQFAPTAGWSFLSEGTASETMPSDEWDEPSLGMSFSSQEMTFKNRLSGNRVGLAIDLVGLKAIAPASPVVVIAEDRSVTYDPAIGWNRINLDGIEPVVPDGGTPNDAIERIPLMLSNPSEKEQIARLLFEKTARGIRQRIGTPITGISAVLCDAEGNPTGIPVQLSKNWHKETEGGIYAEQWFHGLTQVRLPAKTEIELELKIVCGHWGGIPAASHSQLSLIGWGYNQRWDQSALGSWGESVCYNPDQALGNCSITDVRPLMVTAMNGKPWGWTDNVGGGDFFRLFDSSGNRMVHRSMDANYRRYGPCLTEVVYSGKIGAGIQHSETVSLTRTDEFVRATYRVRLDVGEPIDFSRFVIFQIGADTYNFSQPGKFALGNESGLVAEWTSHPGGDAYQTEPREAAGKIPWISLHESGPSRPPKRDGAWANRGIVIREWKARLGGKDAPPWIAEYGTTTITHDSSTIDIVSPPGVTRFEKGDFVEATIEYIIMPQFADDYYGPNKALHTALEKDGNTWRMIHREATGNARQVEVKTGTLERGNPDIRLSTKNNAASLVLTGGLGYVPVTITGLTQPSSYKLTVDGIELDQSVHGNDFWQTDFDSVSRCWSQTFNIPITDGNPHQIEFSKRP